MSKQPSVLCEYKNKWKVSLLEHKTLYYLQMLHAKLCIWIVNILVDVLALLGSQKSITQHKRGMHGGINYPCDSCGYVAKNTNFLDTKNYTMEKV